MVVNSIAPLHPTPYTPSHPLKLARNRALHGQRLTFINPQIASSRFNVIHVKQIFEIKPYAELSLLIKNGSMGT
jgi:hypothetical protein